MIKLEKGEKPNILTEKQSTWQEALEAAVQEAGSYKNIDRSKRERLIKYYKHEEIKERLFASSAHKCAYCECKPESGGGNIEVEHFQPKSIYYQLVFDWDNLLPSCSKCNRHKSAHDVNIDPIINPYEIDPKAYFFYKSLKIKAADNNLIGNTTIDILGLNSPRLIRARSELLVKLNTFENSIEAALENYKLADTEQKRLRRSRKIINAIEQIELLTLPTEIYSAYCKDFLENCVPYTEAKTLISKLPKE